MEVKKGYRSTQIGVIPDEWEVYQLHDVGKVIRGASPRPKGDKRYYGGDIPRLMVEDVTRDGKVVFPKVDYLTMEGALKSRPCKKGTLTIVCSGTVGVVSFLGIDACIHDGFIGLINIQSKYDDDYLYHQLSSLQEVFNNSATHGGVFTNLTTSGVKEFNIPIPPTIIEQTAIATYLSNADTLIKSCEKLISKKRKIRQGAMQQLLKPKDGWMIKTLGELANDNIEWSFTGGPFGSNLKSSDYTENGIRIIQLQNIGDGRFINENAVYTSKAKADELISCNIFPGDIILSKMGDPVARACIIPDYHQRYLMCSDGIRLSVDININNPYFICTIINSPSFRILAEKTSTGSTRKRIGLKELRNLELFVPTITEQTRIASILYDMDVDITAIETKLDKYKQIKMGMMQNLLTGRIRLV